MKKIFSFLLALKLLCWLFSLIAFKLYAVHAQTLSLSLSLDSDKFVESEEILVRVSVINRSGIPQNVQPLILSPESQGVRFTLRDHTGTVVPPSGSMITDDFSKYIEIPAFDSLSEVFDITGMFSTSGNAKAPPYLVTMHYLKSSDYSLQAQTFTGKDTIRSNVVRFTVVRATGEEAKALQELAKADQGYLSLRNKDEIGRARAYGEFINNFSKSVYVPYAYHKLIFIYWVALRNEQRALDLVAELAERFPDHGRAIREMTGYSYMFIREGKTDVLERILRSHPNSEVAKLIQRRLTENQR